MVWLDFTQSHIRLFKPVKYSLDNNNILLTSMKNERNRLKQFIRSNKSPEIRITKISGNDTLLFDKKIKKYSSVSWVDRNGLCDELPNMDLNYKIEWDTIEPTDEKQTKKTNQIYIKASSDKVKSILQRIKYLVWFIEYLKQKTLNSNKQVNIFLILSDLKKMFPKNKQIIGIKHVNTGYTDFVKNIIFIWRYEEFEKVLFHEVIHYLDMDSRHHHVEQIAEVIGPHSYYEAITDVWGIYYHLIYLSFITKRSLKIMLELELGFIRNQAMILNEYMGLGNWVGQPDKLIKQSTPAFSYYILKYIIFEYLLENNYFESNNYNELLKSALATGFRTKPCIKINSSRMTLLQIN